MVRRRFTVGLTVVLGLAACGRRADERDRAVRERQGPSRARGSAEDRPPITAAAPPFSCVEIGTTRANAPVSEEAVAANERALRAHRAGRLEESERGFRAVVDSAPGFAMARFNHACALTRLGREEEAWRELGPLLCADLPTFGPRLASDPDLRSLVDDPRTAPALAALAERYLAAARRGTPLVSYAHGPPNARLATRWETAQAGVYLHEEARFVPMGPTSRERGQLGQEAGDGVAIVATTFDPTSRRVLVVTAVGNDAEGGSPLERLRVQIVEAARGTTLVDQPIREALFTAEVALGSDGTSAVVRDPEERLTLAVTAGGVVRSTASAPSSPTLVLLQASWSLERPTSGPSIVAGKLRTPTADIPLGPGHRALASHEVVVDEGRRVAFAISGTYAECESRDRFVIDRIDLATGTVERLASGEGQPHAAVGSDGAFYLQVGDQLRRYPDLHAASFETLRPGLGLTSLPSRGNPYC